MKYLWVKIFPAYSVLDKEREDLSEIDTNVIELHRHPGRLSEWDRMAGDGLTRETLSV